MEVMLFLNESILSLNIERILSKVVDRGVK